MAKQEVKSFLEELQWIDVSSRKTMEALIKHQDGLIDEIPIRKVLALLSIEKYHEHYKSLLIIEGEKIYVSLKTTREWIQALTRQLHMSYKDCIQLMDLPEKRYKIPYVYKHVTVLPESGASRRESNWYFLNFMTMDSIHESSQRAIIHFEKFKLITQINLDFFKEQMALITLIYAEQISEYKSWMANEIMRSRALYQMANEESKEIVQRRFSTQTKENQARVAQLEAVKKKQKNKAKAKRRENKKENMDKGEDPL